MSTIFYTVEKETKTIDTIETCTGMKTINVYVIALDKPKLWFGLDVRNEDSSENVIQIWLDDNGFGNREYEFKCL